MDLIVKDTRNGQGIYTTRDFSAGGVLYEITGHFISGGVDEEIDEPVRDNAFRYSEEQYISPDGSIGDFQNHSCEPNAMIEKRNATLCVVALSGIQKGDEVTIDYSTITGADDVWEMKCNCGSGVCRGVVRSFDTLPLPLQEKYKRKGMVPEYIVSLSDDVDLIE